MDLEEYFHSIDVESERDAGPFVGWPFPRLDVLGAGFLKNNG
jgi:hypothetical protein